MRRASALLSVLWVAGGLWVLAGPAAAGGCSAALPVNGAVAGWKVLDGSTMAGAMGSKASFDAYDGAVEGMRDEQCIRFFAQRVLKRAKPKSFVTVDVYQFASVAQAKAFFARTKKDYKAAKGITVLKGTKDQAFAGILNSAGGGFCQRGKYVCQVMLTVNGAAPDVKTITAFVKWVSGRLGK
jgi:hypothetical protein